MKVWIVDSAWGERKIVAAKAETALSKYRRGIKRAYGYMPHLAEPRRIELFCEVTDVR